MQLDYYAKRAAVASGATRDPSTPPTRYMGALIIRTVFRIILDLCEKEPQGILFASTPMHEYNPLAVVIQARMLGSTSLPGPQP